MTQGKLKIHTENILPIIKRWLYSDKDIFLRELISNSCDAIRKLQILRDQSLANFSDDELKIELKIDKNQRTLQFSDTGIGMTAEEVEKYIAQIAFSGAEEFLNKYQHQTEKDQIIGHFGLGFYSAYMVAEKVTIDTLSYLTDSLPAFWSCTGSSDYLLEEGKRKERGTTITLYIDPSNDEFLEESRLEEILNKYCQFLPYPIYLNGKRINEKEPLWLKPASECVEKDYLEFYHTLYPTEPDPIFWIHLNVDVPFHLKGILYFPKITRRFEWNKSHLQLFVNRVFVSDNCKDLIPDFLVCLKGAIDSPDIPINVSRSSLQMDRTVKSLSAHISKKVADKLSLLFTQEKAKFEEAWPEIEMIVKLGVLQDEKFYNRAKEFLIWKTSGSSWKSLDEIIAKQSEKIFYTMDPHASILELYKDKDVVISSSPFDQHVFSFLETKLSLKFQRIDGALDPSMIDAAREKTLLDINGQTEGHKIAEFFRKALSIDKMEVEAKSLSSDKIPVFVIFDEQSRRMRDVLSLNDQVFSQTFEPKKTLIVNTNHKLIQSLYQLEQNHPNLAQVVAHHLYELSLLSQKEMKPETISQFVHRSTEVIEQLLSVSVPTSSD